MTRTYRIKPFTSKQRNVFWILSRNALNSVYSDCVILVSILERVPPSIKSTWVTGSVGIKVSLESRDPIKLVIGDSLQAFTKTKV